MPPTCLIPEATRPGRARAGSRRRWSPQRLPASGKGLLALVLLAGLQGMQAVAREQAQPQSSGQRVEAVWTPELAPRGPVVVVVSLPEQRAHVYRNGVRIGASPVSTGKPGFDTPSGVFTILDKRREHYSNLYDGAAMPFMQRLTWDGIALHAGGLPGYPASHGCVRLPPAFAQQLYAVTRPGTVVVIAAAGTSPATVTAPGLFAPVDATTGSPVGTEGPGEPPMQWHPERAPEGPLTILLSTADRRLIVLRNAVEIGRTAVEVSDDSLRGTSAYVLLEGSLPEASLALPDRPARRWMAVAMPGPPASGSELRDAVASGRLSIPRAFARVLYDALKPGDTVMVTVEPLMPAGATVSVLESDGAEGEPVPAPP